MCHAMPFSARVRKKKIFDFDIVVKKQIEMWFSVVCSLIDNDTRDHSGQNLL